MPNLIGRTLGPYRILEQIGVGGMATVFKAYQLTMERDVALKILPHYLSDDATFAKRFEREAHAIARLEHAHILPVYDFGACDGITFIAMRYMPGGTLKDRLARGRLPLDEVTRLIGQIGGALDYAHRQGVIHRDVKPGNVLLDDQGEAYLTDFGLARMLESSQQLTASGVGVGTPAYMAPEQGQGLPADQRSDLYSLGVILFEMVTGRVPFEAETPMAVVLKHITEPLPLPRAVRPDVPEPVEKVILKALAKDPDHRYQSAEALTQALSAAARQAAASAPTVVAALPRPARPRFKFPSLKAHHALRAALLLTAGLVVVAAAATLWTQFSPAAAPARTAEPTARPTVLAATAAPSPTAAPPRPSPVVEAGGIPLRVHFASSSDWATVTILSGEALEAWRTLESGGDNVKAATEARTLRLNQPSADAQAGRFVFMVQDGRLRGLSPQASIALRSEKGCWGTTTIEVFNLATGTPLLVERYIHANCERATYILPAARLLTADVPATPTALPGELPLIYPPSPETGRLVIGCGAEPFRQICVAVMQSGQLKPAEPITPELPVYGIASAPSWARFGSQMVFSASPTRTDPPHLYVMQADGSGLQQVMDGEAYDPVWSPDGAWIAFTRNRGLWLVRPDGEDAHEIVAATDLGVAGPAWSPDSRRLAYLLVGDGVFSQLRVVDAAGANPRLVTAFDRSDGFQHGSVVWSSDGRSLAVALWREGGEPAQVRVRDAEDGRETARLEGVPFWWYSNFWPQWGLPPAGGGAAPPG